jgi:hypothetical protein
MVRIQQRAARKPYMRGKRVYRYERRNVAILKKFHSVSEGFLKEDLDERVTVQNGSLIIVLSPRRK